mmetsp:Transcript_799/g.2205  ORF Transcript_799/g.2205 Transcript_799/m.2205 type:complete len:395 (-) Transcript_799:2069-3253(-)
MVSSISAMVSSVVTPKPKPTAEPAAVAAPPAEPAAAAVAVSAAAEPVSAAAVQPAMTSAGKANSAKPSDVALPLTDAAETSTPEASTAAPAAPVEADKRLEDSLSAISDKMMLAAISAAETESKILAGEELSAAEKVAAIEREVKRIEEDRAREEHEAAAEATEIAAAKTPVIEIATPPADDKAASARPDIATPLRDSATAAPVQEAAVTAEAVAAVKAAVKAAPSAASKLRALQDFVEAAELLASESAVVSEKEDLDELAELRRKMIPEAAREDKAIGSLDKRIDKMIAQLTQELESADKAIGDKMKVLDLDGDGIISVSELRTAATLLKKGKPVDLFWEEILDEMDPDHDGKIDKSKLREIVRELEARKEAEEELELSGERDSGVGGGATGR